MSSEEVPELARLEHLINQRHSFPAFTGCRVRYFPLGEALFPALLKELEKAEIFIFLEFFIVEEGTMWEKVLDVLARKAAAGVDVRVVYSGTKTLPRNYPQELEAIGIHCRCFSPKHRFAIARYNLRDHRKILVVDGRVAFTGGVNLADEYINRINRFGHWKDNGVLVYGPAVRSFTLMFLQTWNTVYGTNDYPYLDCIKSDEVEGGYVLPYADNPLDQEHIGKRVYLDLLNRAEKYVYIFTPYLILDGEMENALKFAAKRDVDVRLILPGVPDKKLAQLLAKTHYPSLLAAGVKLYEYTPGFIHAKSFVIDDREAVVGTINLDYLSLHYQFECALYMNRCFAVEEIKRDFLSTQELCCVVTSESVRHESRSIKTVSILMKLIALLHK